MSGELELVDQADARSSSHIVHNALQFLRVAWYRRKVIFITFVVMALLCTLHAATATRYYRASSTILILQSSGPRSLVPTIGTDAIMQQQVMPTYQALLQSAVVLENAGKKIDSKYQAEFDGRPKSKWGDVIAKRLHVSSIRKTKLLTLQFDAKDPAVAVEVLNAVIHAYFEFIDATHKSNAEMVIKTLTGEKKQIEEKLVNREADLLRTRQSAGTLGIRSDTALHPVVQTAIRLNEALVTAELKRLEFKATLSSIQSSIRNGESLQQHILAVQEAVGQQILMAGLGLNSRDAGMQASLERNLLQDRAELQTLMEHFGDAHPKVMEVRQRIRSTEEYLNASLQRINAELQNLQNNQLGPMLVQMIQQSLNKASEEEAALRSSYEDARKNAIAHEGKIAEVEILEHDVNRMRRLHDVLVEQIASTDLHHEKSEVHATVVKEPISANGPVSPKVSLIAIFCIFASLVVGCLIVYIQDILDDRFRDPDELSIRVGVPVLAMVGKLEDNGGHGADAIQAFLDPNALEMEAFRTLRTALAFNVSETGRLVVSSAEPGDGKTTVLANLAVTFAQSGKRTLLIDADMRRPGMTKLLSLKGVQGLSDILYSEQEAGQLAEQLVIQTDQPDLDLIVSGPRRPNPAELLSGPRMGELLAWADGKYDQILIDCPPVLAASDALMVGRLVDGAIIVVRPEKNRRRMVTRAVENFAEMQVEVLGVIANCVSGNDSKAYGFDQRYGYGYGYGYGDNDADDDSDNTVLQYQDESELSADWEAHSHDAVIVPRKVA